MSREPRRARIFHRFAHDWLTLSIPDDHSNLTPYDILVHLNLTPFAIMNPHSKDIFFNTRKFKRKSFKTRVFYNYYLLLIHVTKKVNGFVISCAVGLVLCDCRCLIGRLLLIRRHFPTISLSFQFSRNLYLIASIFRKLLKYARNRKK